MKKKVKFELLMLLCSTMIYCILYLTTSFSLHLISPNEQTCLHSSAASIGEDRHSAQTGPGSAPGLCTPSLLHPSTLHPSTSHHLTKWVNESKCYSEGATENQATESKGKGGRERGREEGREREGGRRLKIAKVTHTQR